jgi:hypothetical protein
VRQLQGDVRAQLLRRETVDHLAVGDHDALSLRRLEHALAEQRRVRPQSLLVEATEHGDAFVEGLSGDEARGAEAHAVPADEALDPGAVGRGEDALAEAGVDRDV